MIEDLSTVVARHTTNLSQLDLTTAFVSSSCRSKCQPCDRCTYKALFLAIQETKKYNGGGWDQRQNQMKILLSTTTKSGLRAWSMNLFSSSRIRDWYSWLLNSFKKSSFESKSRETTPSNFGMEETESPSSALTLSKLSRDWVWSWSRTSYGSVKQEERMGEEDEGTAWRKNVTFSSLKPIGCSSYELSSYPPVRIFEPPS